MMKKTKQTKKEPKNKANEKIKIEKNRKNVREKVKKKVDSKAEKKNKKSVTKEQHVKLKKPNKFKFFLKKYKKEILIGLILGVLISSVVLIIYKNAIFSLIGLISVFGLSVLYGYLRRILKAAARVKKTESVFPDFLQLMASNLRAGMTIDKALLLSSRPEFAPLDKEITTVGKDIATGKTLESSLTDMAKRINSRKIEKTVFLIISGIRAGGNLSILLEETSRNMRQRGFIEKRAASNVLMYVIFVFVAASVGAPILFSLSSLLVQTLVNTISGMQSFTEITTSSLPFSFSAVNVSVDFVKYFSIVFIITTDILASLVLGLVGKGEEREGVKYIIPMVVISLVIFFVLRMLLSGFVINLFG
jgi:flagellar protein FlaJ